MFTWAALTKNTSCAVRIIKMDAKMLHDNVRGKYMHLFRYILQNAHPILLCCFLLKLCHHVLWIHMMHVPIYLSLHWHLGNGMISPWTDITACGMGKHGQLTITTKHDNARTVCIFLLKCCNHSLHCYSQSKRLMPNATWTSFWVTKHV